MSVPQHDRAAAAADAPTARAERDALEERRQAVRGLRAQIKHAVHHSLFCVTHVSRRDAETIADAVMKLLDASLGAPREPEPMKAVLITQTVAPSERVVLVAASRCDDFVASLDRSRVTRVVVFDPEVVSPDTPGDEQPQVGEPGSKQWGTPELRSAANDAAIAEQIVAWVNANGGEARYEPECVDHNGPQTPARIAIRTASGWDYAKPGDRVVKGDRRFISSWEGIAWQTLREFYVSPVESAGSEK